MNIRIIHHCLGTVINVVAVSLNCFLLFLIVRHSNKYTKVYRYVLLATCISDLVQDSFLLIEQPVNAF